MSVAEIIEIIVVLVACPLLIGMCIYVMIYILKNIIIDALKKLR